MKAFKGYNETKAYTNSDREQLPKGGYVCKILKAEVVKGQYGEQLKVSFDITEGEYAGFFEKQYRGQEREDKTWIGVYYLPIPSDDGSESDAWSKRRFKTFTEAVEASNDGYHWDWNEAGLKGRLFGALFSIKQKEYNGKVYDNTVCSGAASVQNVRDGKYRLPKDKLKSGSATQQAQAVDPAGFMQIPEGEDDGLPF